MPEDARATVPLTVPQGEVWIFGHQAVEVWTQAKDGVLKGAAVAKDPLNVAEESLAVTCPHCGHTSDVRIPARFKP